VVDLSVEAEEPGSPSYGAPAGVAVQDGSERRLSSRSQYTARTLGCQPDHAAPAGLWKAQTKTRILGRGRTAHPAVQTTAGQPTTAACPRPPGLEVAGPHPLAGSFALYPR
jgi:hypothetical protein